MSKAYDDDSLKGWGKEVRGLVGMLQKEMGEGESALHKMFEQEVVRLGANLKEFDDLLGGDWEDPLEALKAKLDQDATELAEGSLENLKEFKEELRSFLRDASTERGALEERVKELQEEVALLKMGAVAKRDTEPLELVVGDGPSYYKGRSLPKKKED